jgi:alpha-beta hydrolase superfamily lysophospholipase
VYLIAGDCDPVSGNTRQLEPWIAEYRAAGITDLQYRFYPGARHELFSEIKRDEVIADLLSWLNRVAGAAGTTVKSAIV